MRFRTDKILGGLNVNGISKSVKAAKAEPPKMGAIQMTGVYAKGSLEPSAPQSNFSVPPYIVDKYADVEQPNTPPKVFTAASFPDETAYKGDVIGNPYPREEAEV